MDWSLDNLADACPVSQRVRLGRCEIYRKDKDCLKKALFLLRQSCFDCDFMVRYMVASVCAVSMMPPPINPSP